MDEGSACSGRGVPERVPKQTRFSFPWRLPCCELSLTINNKATVLEHGALRVKFQFATLPSNISYHLDSTDFIQVPMPRAALKDLANARGLAAAAAEARAETPYTAEKGYGDEPEGVELWADWPCSSVRLRGEPAVVRRAVSLTTVMNNPTLYGAPALFDHKSIFTQS